MTEKEEAIIILDGFKDNPLFNEQHKKALDMAIKALSENKRDLISRQAVKDIILGGVSTDTDVDKEYVCGLIDNLPSVENKGEWIYDKNIDNWRCSKCGQTPPPTGYVGKADFMATYFKICPNCGADMREPIGEKGTE